MVTTLQSWGNSQGIRLPKPLLAALRLETGADVRIDLSPKKDAIMVRAVKPAKRKVRLKDLAAAMPRGYKAAEFGWKPAGREVW